MTLPQFREAVQKHLPNDMHVDIYNLDDFVVVLCDQKIGLRIAIDPKTTLDADDSLAALCATKLLTARGEVMKST